MLHILADYNTGIGYFASSGFLYRFSQQWSVKSGIEWSRMNSPDVLAQVIFSGSYD